MLTPEYLSSLPEAILKLWEEAELTILRDMARRIAAYNFWIPAADYQNERLLASGRTQEEILSVLAGVTKKSEAELRKMMVDAGSRCLRDDVAVYTAAGLTPPAIADSKELTAILNEGYKATAQTMKNLTRTTARTATRQFEDVLDTAWTQVSSGAFDAESAVRQAVKHLSKEGIEAIRYPSGHVDTVETAVRRAVLTGVNQTAARLQEELADEVGCDLVEVSAHAGARPEHAEWQGKIYSRSGKSEKYPDFRSSTGYGTGAGLCGWNCRHTFGPYIEGSPRVWTDEKLAELSAPKYEYQGEKFTEYEARQKEKYFDRQITRWQREAEAMKAAGQDPAEAQAKVKAWERRKSDFVLNRTAVSNQKISEIAFDNRVSDRQKELIQILETQYNTRLKTVTIGADRGAGDVDITGARMRLSDKHENTAIHEFAHTIATYSSDKVGLSDNKEFWKEISNIQRSYYRDANIAQNPSRWISSYEHSARNIDEFMAEAFAHAKMKELGLIIPDKYGKDFTYSQVVLDTVDKYFGLNRNGNQVYRKTGDPLFDAIGPAERSHPKQIKAIVEKATNIGVEIRDGLGRMAYSPGTKRGKPGQLFISKQDSYGAWLHEEQHMLDDYEDGWLGFEGLFDIDRRSRMEYNAYMKEIDFAKSIEREDIADILRQNYYQEVESFGGEPIEIEREDKENS